MVSSAGPVRPPVKTLLIDNYDSFTFNLYQLIAVVNGAPPVVVYNDVFEGNWESLCAAFPDIDNIVISPGPGTPENPSDLGISVAAFSAGKPLLGVCLGHQALGYICGAKIQQAPEIVHGRRTEVEFSPECTLFDGVGQCATVARYHSLCIAPESLPDCLSLTAWTHSPPFTIMGVQNRHRPFFGIQFHPESVGSPCGETILRNFKEFTCKWQAAQSSPPPRALQVEPPNSALLQPPAATSGMVGSRPGPTAPQAALWEVNVAAVSLELPISPIVNACKLFQYVFEDSPVCFWLDSSSADPSLAAPHARELEESVSRFSYMGDGGGPCCVVLEGHAEDKTRQMFRCPQGCGCGEPERLHTREVSSDVFDALRVDGTLTGGHEALRLRHWNAVISQRLTGEGAPELSLAEGQPAEGTPPFKFLGGYVGYLAYELRHRAFARLSGSQRDTVLSRGGKPAERNGALARAPPLALWLFADRYVAVDNKTGSCFVVWLVPNPQASSCSDSTVVANSECESLVQCLRSRGVSEEVRKSIADSQEAWALDIISKIAACASSFSNETGAFSAPTHNHNNTAERDGPPVFRGSLTEAGYKGAIEAALEEIRLGNAYEVCLTDQLTANYDPLRLRPLGLYSRLRCRNRAKLGAYIKCDLGGSLSGVAASGWGPRSVDFAVCCSSPELFLEVDTEGWVESRPIKGTRRRGSSPREDAQLAAELAASEKDKAENMMIVDLVRNDLGRVCRVGSVSVPRFLAVETHPAVHHMVSTVRGQLRVPECDVVDAVIAAFPGGSMTGAPKISAMNIIHRLEAGPRGIYSGTLGFLSLTGAACLNIVIRTAVLSATQATVGAGGAIISLSDVAEEFEEMELKAASVTRSFACN